MERPPSPADRAAARHYAETSARVQELEAQLEQVASETAALRAELARVESSISWQGIQALRRRLHGRGGEHSHAARAVSATLHAAAALAARGGAPAPPQPAPEPPPALAEVPRFAEPEVSLILPVHSQPELTAACVRAIVRTATVPYELIIVDDTATAAVKAVVERISGTTVIVNRANCGYTRSLNRGAQRARGEFLILLNDDTEPQPGWLEAMLGCGRSAADIGVVTPMYLAPDGSLKEAGSIVWSDGSAENFGRGDQTIDRARYRHQRDVDYGSGACLLVRTALFRELGGLDEQFSPAYYEDVDLCFAAREAGARVVYEPNARVIHVEGATAGTDTESGGKRFQLINQVAFASKWRRRLAEQPDRGSSPRRASTRARGPRVLIADESVPTPDRDGGSRRMWQLIRAFRELDCAVTMLPAGGPAAELYAGRLEAAGVEVLRRPDEVDDELVAIGRELNLAVLSRPHIAARYAYRLRELAPSARLVYDTVDLHHLRELRRSIIEDTPAADRVTALRELELAMVRCCDATIVVNDDERHELLRSVPDAEIEVIATIAELAPAVPPLAGRAGIVFVGGFRHAPNVDAAEFLVGEVMPHIWRQRDDARLTLVGEHPPRVVEALAGPRVAVTGWVEDLDPVLAHARVAVAPMRFGAGVQIKAIEAMASGVPVVATSLAAAGVAGADGVHMLVADEPEQIAQRICALLEDDELWQRLSRAGRALVAERYAPDVVVPRIRALLPAQPAFQPSP